jgi:Ca2+-transporting ATPase
MLMGIIFITLLMLALLLTVVPFRDFFSFATVEMGLLLRAMFLGFLSVIWFEGYKAYLRTMY